MLLAFLGLAVGLAFLVYGADRFVSGAASTAKNLGVKPMVIGLTIVGFSTSAPEILVGSVAAWSGKTQIAIGNAIGSNIANIGLVLGAAVVFSPMFVNSKTLQREYILMMAAIGMGLLLLYDLDLSRFDGMILIFCMIVITYIIIRVAKISKRADPLMVEFEHELEHVYSNKKAILLLIFGLILLLAGAEILVRSAVFIAKDFGISDLVIGLTIIAVGTSLPELAASIVSVHKDEADIAIGNIIGSNMFNMLAVLGFPAIIQPAAFGKEVLLRDFPIMVGLSILMGLMVFLRGHGKFTRGEGVTLLLCFGTYQYWLFHTVNMS